MVGIKKAGYETATPIQEAAIPCLLYTSDAADERSSVDLGGRRIIKKKKTKRISGMCHNTKRQTDYKTHQRQDAKMNKETE